MEVEDVIVREDGDGQVSRREIPEWRGDFMVRELTSYYHAPRGHQA